MTPDGHALWTARACPKGTCLAPVGLPCYGPAGTLQVSHYERRLLIWNIASHSIIRVKVRPPEDRGWFEGRGTLLARPEGFSRYTILMEEDTGEVPDRDYVVTQRMLSLRGIIAPVVQG